MSEPYYEYHVFFCTNKRTNGRVCCADAGAEPMRAYAKQQIKALGLHGAGKVRINKSGCMDRCEEGPTVVVYPEGVWYSYDDRDDIDEIINEHLVNGRIVERLVM